MNDEPHNDDVEWLVEQLYLSGYWNHDDIDDVNPGYEYAINQLLSDMRSRTGLPTKDMERRAAAKARAKYANGVRVE